MKNDKWNLMVKTEEFASLSEYKLVSTKWLSAEDNFYIRRLTLEIPLD